ncbi:Clp protease ClpP [Listeria monocytogenes]|uniref:ATP-dependent Clp protease proteolytic subunit n=1 Tax=Listeria monocytogenes TaxID=1639 RepID=A0A823J5G2_LISMN|nr:head maturation protease, ClpP-related [Listeria monocytogenes]EAG9223052.1 Clp protease ClpP [Listeria monocytogenes]EAG9354857.1 Clp protease ClpP [Listeria monocytogenes]OET20139.1 Clp protease ClpP [Listeria monocytogenes]OFG93506.1 Clp protease ClpP [Listeria monocytogenes]RFQ28271.1 Clp protease ClpP [Listeria monocytogenes]
MKKFWEMKQSATKNEAEIYIYGEIVSFKWDEEDTTALSFQKDLKELGNIETINLHVNSPGGNVFEGIAISNMIKAHKAKVIAYVDALAASIASVIVAGADKVVMYENSMQMIHNPTWNVSGNSTELRKHADDLDAIAQASVLTYLSKAGDKLSEEKIKQIMAEETWLSAKDALGHGLCDEILEANKIAAYVEGDFLENYQHVPLELKQLSKNDDSLITDERKQIAEEARASAFFYDQFLGGMTNDKNNF